MKKLLLVILVAAFSTPMLAQSVVPEAHADTIFGTPNQFLENKFDVTNTSSNGLRVMLRRSTQNIITGTTNNFCWGPLCYPGFVDTATAAEFLVAGGIDTSFKAQYQPAGNEGVSSIEYCFYDSLDIADELCVTLHFKTTEPPVSTALIEKEQGLTLGQAYPNPATSLATFSYRIDNPGNTFLVIRNLLGAEVSRNVLSRQQGQMIVPVRDLENGIYLYSLESNGQVYQSRRLVVAH